MLIPPSPPVLFTLGFSYLRQDASSCFELIRRCRSVRKSGVPLLLWVRFHTVLQVDLT
jgi:hypothetical protein